MSNILENALEWVENEFSKASTIENSIAKYADAVTNELKALEANKTVQFLQNGLIDIAESLDPGLTPIINGLELEIPKILNLVTGITTEITKPDNEQVNDAVAKLNEIKGINGTIYGNLINGVNSAIQGYATANNGIVTTTPQLIASALAVHAGS